MPVGTGLELNLGASPPSQEPDLASEDYFFPASFTACL